MPHDSLEYGPARGVELTAEDRKRDRYYRRKYGVGVDWYEWKLMQQNNACGICRRPASIFTNRLSIDHDHAYKKVKISAVKDPLKGWVISVKYLGQTYMNWGKPKPQLMREIRQILQSQSVRGLLCNFCNRGLRYYQDRPERLANAAEYLREHQGEK